MNGGDHWNEQYRTIVRKLLINNIETLIKIDCNICQNVSNYSLRICVLYIIIFRNYHCACLVSRSIEDSYFEELHRVKSEQSRWRQETKLPHS